MGSEKTQAEKNEAIKQAEKMLKNYEKERKEHCTPCTGDDKTNLTVVGAKEIPDERGYQVEITNAAKIGLKGPREATISVKDGNKEDKIKHERG